MNYILGPAAFATSPRLQDVTIYGYASPTRTRFLKVTSVPGAIDAESLLSSSEQALRSFYGSLIVYTNRIRFPHTEGVTISAVEGELDDPLTGAPARFGLSVLVNETSNISLFYRGERRDFLPHFRSAVQAVHFIRGSVEYLAPPAAGLSRHQAQHVYVDVPQGWSCPTTLLFESTRSDDVSLRVTIAERPSPKGAVSFAEELPSVPGDRVAVLSEAITPEPLDEGGWSGTWSVEHSSPIGVRIMTIRKACRTYPAGGVMTLYGKAPARHVSELDDGWNAIMGTLAPRRTP